MFKQKDSNENAFEYEILVLYRTLDRARYQARNVKDDDYKRRALKMIGDIEIAIKRFEAGV